MEIKTITQIRELRDSIREQIKEVDFNEFIAETYGGELEYNYKGIIGGLEALLTDISTLTKAPKKFIKISTSAERTNIVNYLTRIDSYFNSPTSYLAQFEALKILLRGFNVRSFSERQIEFESEIEETRKIKLELQQELAEVKKLKTEIEENNLSIETKAEESNEKLDEIESQLDKIIKRKEELIEQSETLEEINTDLYSIKEKATENLEEIVSSMTESKSNEKLITSFANKIQERDKRLGELEQNTEENNKKLNDYENERFSILEESKELIESAKKALNYKTAEGISASFQTQYDNANNKSVLGWWLFGAIICLISTILLGLWVLESTTTTNNVGLIIGRISLLPLPIIGAIFCANQYTKQKNIIEDYAYKMVLSKSMVGFSEQLKKNGSESNEEYIHYIKTALEEIHKDPLRKRDKNKENKNETPQLKDLVEFAEKMVKMTKVE
tara:strand:- start:1118 stop:2455 length:1338 start_codon:yes stop_codon:yes gene_type:complete